MVHSVDARLVHEAERFRFRFTCEQCGAYDATNNRCAEGYPTSPHRNVDLTSASRLTFCKAFELA